MIVMKTTHLMGWLVMASMMSIANAYGVQDESWKLPLNVKEQKIEENILLRHNILGLYPSMVEVPADGGAIDITTSNPFADIQHAVCWTSNYLAGASYRYAFLKKSGASQQELETAKKRADEIFEAVYRCQRVTGKRGLQARGYFLGHGETYAERFASSKLPYWHQGEVDGQAFRWVGDPSHHNYSDAIHGLGQYYDLVAEGEQKDRCREAIDALVGYWVDNNLTIIGDLGEPVPILGLTDGKTLNTRIMMAIAGAKVAHHATGNEKYKEVYDRLIAQYGVRGLKKFKTEKDFDDAEHVFCHLENLFRIEKDPELLAAFRVVADGLWENHKNDAQSLFTYIYMSIAPDVAQSDAGKKALQEALYSLQTFPTDMTLRPRMNSIRKDLKPPYPVYAAAWDNEYIWKGNLLNPDGWWSRIVMDVAVPNEDPMVIYALDEIGDIYKSRDGASSEKGWEPIAADPPTRARAIEAGPRVRMLYAACEDGFYMSTTGGTSWKRLPVPTTSSPIDILLDPENENILYAVAESGVWRSIDFGEKFRGEKWENLTDALPSGNRRSFHVALGKPSRIYAVIDGMLFVRRLDAPDWLPGAQLGFQEVTRNYPWLVTDPSNPERAVTGVWGEYGNLGVFSLLRQTEDGGMTWSNDLRTIYRQFAEGGMAALATIMIPHRIEQPAISPHDSHIMFTPVDTSGVLRSTDGGITWKPAVQGLDIPVVKTVFAPRNTEWVFAGTPAGLFVSKDDGATWSYAGLCLQFTKNTRRELGGASFIDAYWRARYYGFIDEKTATDPFKEN